MGGKEGTSAPCAFEAKIGALSVMAALQDGEDLFANFLHISSVLFNSGV